jgi:hypothetical protein
MKFILRTIHPVLLWFRVIVMMWFLLRTHCFLVSHLFRVLLFALVLSRRLVAVADALLGAVDNQLLLLLLLLQVQGRTKKCLTHSRVCNRWVMVCTQLL